MRDEKLYLEDIAQCISKIEDYIASGKEAFLNTPIIQDAVIRNFEIIGEATKNLSPEIRANYPQIEWKRVAGFRDVLIHDYMRVDLDEIWGIIERDLPTLKETIQIMLQ